MPPTLRRGEIWLATAPDVLSIEQTSQLIQGLIFPKPLLVDDLVRAHKNDPMWRHLRFEIADPEPENTYSPSRVHIIGRRPARARAGKRRRA